MKDLVPDSMTTLSKRWLKVISLVGSTLDGQRWMPTLGQRHFAHQANVCRVPKWPTALNVRQIIFISKSVIMVT